MALCSTIEAISEIKKGRMIILVDDEDRENEGDLTIAAEFVTPEIINFMAHHGCGLICLSLAPDICDKLKLPMMASHNTSQFGTNFTVSIEAREGVTTGISAADRATTIRTAVREDCRAEDLVMPGHVFPLRARPGGVLERTGQTEGSVDLAKLAGLRPAAVICEVMKEDGTMDRAAMATITNPDDLNALEAALKLKDATGCEVVVVTMGPPPAEGMLRELLARGADKAVLVSGREFGGSDTFATSQILAAAVNKIGVGPEDVVFCGRQAIDGDTAQVGPQIAEKLHLPQVTYVADIQKDGNTLTVKRMLEDGYMMVKVQTPCLLTCIKELNQPRYMSVNGIFTCYDKPMEVFDYNALKDDPLIEVDTIGLKGSPTNVFKSFTPPQKGAGTMLTGDDVAAQLAGALAKKHLI